MKTSFKVFNYLAIFILVFGFLSQKPVSAADGDPVCVVETSTCFTSIQAAINDASSGDHITVAPGTYVEYLDIPKSITISGTGADRSEVTIDTRGSADYGIHAYGDAISTEFSNFTVIGPSSATYGYGIKVAGDNAQTVIQNVAVRNSGRSGIDLNGLIGSVVDNVLLTNNGGVGLALTNCSNIAVSNITTSGNAWAGMALYTDSTDYTQGSSGVSLTGTNSFGESTKLYFEIDPLFPITGFTQSTFLYTVKNNVSMPNITAFTLTLADALAAVSVIPNPATSSIEQWSDGSQIVVPGMSIQAAINAATPGDTIYVSQGNYSENLTINKSLSLIGDTTVEMVGVVTPDYPDDYNITGPVANHVITITASNVTVSGFNIYNTHGTINTLAAIAVQGAINNVDITDNFIDSDDLGIAIAGATNVTVEDNEILGSNIAVYLLASGNLINHNNISESANAGVYGDEDTTNNTISGNFIIANSGDGVYLWKANTYTINNNVIGGNGNHGIELFGSNNNTITGNTIEDNTATGIRIRLSGTDASHPNAIHLNQYNNPAYNLFVEPGIGTIDATRNWWGSEDQPDFIAKISGPVSYVPWCTDEICTTFGYLPVHNVTQNTYFTTIQAAIDAAITGDTIEVAPGTYVESLDIIGKNITLRAPAGATIESPVDIDTDFTTALANSAVVYLNNTTSTIDGFTIDGAGHGNANYRFYGVAFYNAGGTIQNTTVKNIQDTPFSGAQHGNAIYAYNSDGTARSINVTGNTVYDFQKNGITMNGALLTANVDNNTVTCKGTTSVTAQNGIQIGFGADATLAGNTVSGCSFHLEGSDWDWAATGILLTGSGAVTLEGGNTMTGNSQNLYIDSPVGSIVVGAEIFGSLTGPLESSYHVINFSDSDLNLSTSTFDGVPLADATTAQLLSFAGLVYDGIDDPTIGVALLKSGYQFVDPESSIQAAIDAATPGDIILVAPGTYVENVIVNKTVEIWGSGQGSTIVMPALSAYNPTGCAGSLCAGSSNVFIVQANNVKIHDLTVDGDNPALTTGLDVGGANVDARNGIITNHSAGTFNGLEIYNVTVRNIYLRGIYPSSGGTFNVHHNTVTNVQGEGASIAIFGWGGPGTFANNTVSYANDGISANWSKGISFLNNTVTHSSSGIHTDNAGSGVGSVADLIQGNSIDCTGVTDAYGIFVFSPYIAPTVDQNTVTNCAAALTAFGQAASATGPINTQFTNNTLTGNYSVGSSGILLANILYGYDYTDVYATFTGNTITGFETGVQLWAGPLWGYTPWTPQIIDATFNFNKIYGNTVDVSSDAATGATYIKDFTNNWWGIANGPAMGIVPLLGDYVPWCTNEGCTTFGYPPVHNITQDTYFYTIQTAIAAADAGDTLQVADGIYVETGQIVINKNLTITGTSQAGTILQPAQDTSGSGDAGSWILVNEGVTFNLSNVTLDGTGRNIRQGLRTNGITVVDHVTVQNMMSPGYSGFGIVQGYENTVPQSLTVTNSIITGFGRVGIQADEGYAASTATITNNVITCRGAGDMVNYGITVEGGATATITGNTITNCYGKASTDGSESAAIEVSTYFAPGTTATIFGNFLYNNVNGILIGYDAADTSTVNAENNKIYNIDESAIESTGTAASVDVSPNWWGTAVLSLITPKIDGTVTYLPYWVDEAMTILSSTAPTTVYVDDNYTSTVCGGHICGYDAFATITEGIAAVATSGTVSVADGTYNEAVVVNKAGVTLQSVNGRATTIIDVPDGSYTTGIRVLGTNLGTVTINGFTVRDFTENGIVQGMASRTGTTVHILNNEIFPAATYLRNGIQVTGDGSTVIGNIVHSQYLTVDWASTAIGVVDASNVLVQNNTITGVGNYGISVYTWNSSPVQSNVQVTGNTIDGIETPLAATAYMGGTVSGVDFNLNLLTNYVNAIEAAPYEDITDPQYDGQAVEDIDATHNWWGSRFGPQGPILGEPTLIKWCATATCDTFLPNDSNEILATTADSRVGAIKIYVPHITIILTDGTVIQNSSPCFEIHASYTTIETESIGGAQCIPTSDANAIEIADDLVNITIDGIEFVGTNGTDGLHFAGGISDIVLVDNWFHNLKGDGIDFAEQPTGIINIQGNLFQNNAGVGIRNTTGTSAIDATYNSWGDVLGPTGPNGDGVSAFVTWAPFTHVDLYLTSSGTLVANQVLTGQTITYTVYAHMVNSNSVDFRLAFPTNLTRVGNPVNSGTFTEYAVFDTSVANTIHFYGMAPFGTSVTGDVPVFSVTFTAGAPIVGAPMNLDDVTDAFGMIAYQSSSNIYAASLADSTVTILANSSASGTLSMQGRSTRLGIPVTLTSTELIPWGPYATATLNMISNNLVFSNVAGGTYTFTTNQPRYLNVDTLLGKTALITSNKVFSTLELKGGNAVWTDNVINIGDAGLIGGAFGIGDITSDGDVNFDGRVNVQDLAMVGGNYGLSSASAYSTWVP